MADLITHALSIAIDSTDPPKELRLFRVGINRSLKGAFVFDEQAAREVMANYEAMGHSLTIDYDHGSIRKDAIDPSQSGKSAGRFDLALRDGELWAVNIRWSPAADAAIRREEWPFISPTFTSDENGRVVLVLNFGLTGNPALLDPPRLIAAHQATETQKADHGKARTTIDTEKTMKWNALNDHMQKMGLQKPMMATTLGLAVEALDALMAGDGDMTPEQEAAAKKCPMQQMNWASANGADAVSLSAVSVLAGKPGAGLQDTLARVGELQTAGVQLLSATSCMTLTDAIKRVQTLSATFGELVKATGATDEGQAVAKIKDLCGKQGEIEAGALKAKEVRVLNMLTAAKAEHKITPAEIGGARGLQAMGMKDEDWLADHLKARAPITALSADEALEGAVETSLTSAVVGLVEKDGVVTLNGLSWEKLGSDVKHNLKLSDSPADRKAYNALRANHALRGAPISA